MDQDTILQQILSLVQSIDRRVAALEAREPAQQLPLIEVGGPTPEQQRQAALYADLAAKVDTSDVDPQTYALPLRHPDLLYVSTGQMSLRAAGGITASTMYGIAQEDLISWWGGLIRADGQQGMYATQAQADAWDDRVSDGTSIGPG